MFVYSIQRGIELGLLDKSEYGPVASRGYRALLTFARVNEHGLVDLDGGADGVCIMPDYAHYIGQRRAPNAKEAVGGFLWATAIMEKPALDAHR
jgi:unsaturated rhamnogalacturonyl hydrolase